MAILHTRAQPAPKPLRIGVLRPQYDKPRTPVSRLRKVANPNSPRPIGYGIGRTTVSVKKDPLAARARKQADPQSRSLCGRPSKRDGRGKHTGYAAVPNCTPSEPGRLLLANDLSSLRAKFAVGGAS